MAFTKTRIWRGGVSGTSESQPDDRLEATGAAPREAEFSAAPDDAALFERTARDLASPGPLKGFETDRTSPLATTRFLPIEELFPEQQTQAREPVALTPLPRRLRRRSWLERLRVRSARYESLPARPRSRRRVLLLVFAAAIVVAATLAIPDVRRELSAAHAAATRAPKAHSQSRVSATPSDAPQRAPEAASAPVHSASDGLTARASPSQKPQGLERSAIDALISGDVTRAAQLYGRLADGAPREPVYREARRILLNRAVSR